MGSQRKGHNLCSLVLQAGFLLLSASLLQAAPLVLNDADLDRITAGNTESQDRDGVIVGNSSWTIVQQTAGVVLGEQAQEQARGLNLVNSSTSAVANGVNVWDGQGVAGTDLKMAQVNHVEQTQPHSAVFSDYSRSHAEHRLQVDTFRSENYQEQLQSHHEIKDIYTRKHTSTGDSTSSVDTSLDLSIGAPGSDVPFFELETNVGHGVAVAGHLDAHFDGGSAEFVSTAKGSVETGTEINVGDYFRSEVSLSATAEFSLSAEIDLPSLDVQVNGAGCGVVLGSCQASGWLSERTEEIFDNSTIDSLTVNSATNNQFTETSTEEHRSPFSLGEAQAEYIIVDNSSMVLESDETLELSGSAQKNSKGMNVVNAVGSTVSNVVNVARSRQLNYRGELMLTQFNFVVHGR